MKSRSKYLVDPFEGKISRSIFSSEKYYDQEINRIFSKVWLCVGHESLIPERGDYFLSFMGELPVILVRDIEDNYHVILNDCPHGNQVIMSDEGNSFTFRCPHGSVFSNDGKQLDYSVPNARSQRQTTNSGFDLLKTPKTTEYRGFIFATWDKNSPSLERYLGDIRWYLDTLIDRRAGGIQLLGPIKWRGAFNWKIPADHFMGGQFYASLTKPDTADAPILPALADEDPYSRKGYTASVGNGHGVGMRFADTHKEFNEFLDLYRMPELAGYERSIQSEMEHRLGTIRSHQLFPHNATVFPNLSFLWDSPSLHIWHPRGAQETEVWTFAIVDKAAPEIIRRYVRRIVNQLTGPSGILEQNAANSWSAATNSGKSIIGRKFPMDISMGIGHEEEHPEMPGTVVPHFYSEIPQRGMYKFWQEMLNARSWRGVNITPPTK